MVNSVTGSGDVSPSWKVAQASPRKAPDAAGVRPQAINTRICSEDGYTFIQAIGNAFGYRESGLLAKYDLRTAVSDLVPPAPLTGSPATNVENAKKRDAQINTIADQVWTQLLENGYIDASGIIQDKFSNTSPEDFASSINVGDPKVTKGIYETISRSDNGDVESRISSGYVLERTRAGFGKLPYNDVMLLLSSLKALGYVSDAKPGKTEKATRERLIEGLAKFQDAHPEIEVSVEDKGNRVGPGTITALVKELRNLK